MISKQTENQVIEIVLKYLPVNQAADMFFEIMQVKGSKAFEESAAGLFAIMERRKIQTGVDTETV